MSDRKIDFSKLTDFEVEMLVIERDTAQYKKERIDELLNSVGQVKGVENATKPKTATAALPGSVDLGSLPWKSYATKQAAKPEESGWIFRNVQGAEIKTHDKVKIGSFEYSFSGKEKQFISRNMPKEKAS